MLLSELAVISSDASPIKADSGNNESKISRILTDCITVKIVPAKWDINELVENGDGCCDVACTLDQFDSVELKLAETQLITVMGCF